jgi:dTDP-4-amino-4,6-dideoxygalactose transaminase
MSQNTEVRRIPFSRPILGPAEEQAVLEVMRSGWLTTGKRCQAFEADFSARSGLPHALAVNSATSGLHLALEALDIKSGDRLAVSPYTFTATCEVMRYLGAHPHFVDIEPGSFHMDLDALERDLEQARKGAIPPIRAIVPVHIGGVGWRMAELYALAARFGLPVLEDAAHAWPARSAEYRNPAVPDGYFLGSGGEIGVYSFYANKTITTGEGGMVVCRDPALAKRMKTMRSHGIDREVWNRFTTNADQWRYAVVEAGYKYNLPDLAAAIGCVQLGRADAFMAERRAVAQAYNRAFETLDWLTLPPRRELADKPAVPGAATDPALAHSWHLYSLRLRDDPRAGELEARRDAFVRRLDAAGVGISVHYIPLHMHPYYARTYGLKPGDFPVARDTYRGTFSLPVFPGMREDEIGQVVEAVRSAR